MLHSLNARVWSKGKLPDGLSCDLNAVVFAFGQFWAGGRNLKANQAVLLLSFDGVNWSDVSANFVNVYSTSTPLAEIYELFFYSTPSSKVLVASANVRGYSDRNLISTSQGSVWDFESWDASNLFQAGDRLFYLDEYNDWSALEPNGSGWDTDYDTTVDNYLPDILTKVAVGNSYFVGAGAQRRLGYWNGKVDDDYNTPDGFAYAISPAATDYTGIAYGSGSFVASGTQGALVESYDNGKTWLKSGLNVGSVNLNGVRFVGGKFIAFGGGRILTGEPVLPRSWRAATLPSRPQRVWSLASNGKKAVSVGSKGEILHSSDGLNWKKAPPQTSSDLYSVDYDAATQAFYATGENGSLLRSSNGINWQVLKSNTTDYLFGVARAGKTLFSAGAGGSFLTSKDGKKWTSNNAGALGSPGRLVSFGKRVGFIQGYQYDGGAIGQVWANGGATWTKLRSPDSTLLSDAATLKSTVYLAGQNGYIYSSQQNTVGNSWKKISTRTENEILGLCANSGAGGRLTAVGEEGFVFTLSPNGKWRSETIFEGLPLLNDVIFFKGRWIVAGLRNGAGFIATTGEY